MKGHCTACDRKLRKGSTRRGLVFLRSGEIVSGLLCMRCRLRAVSVVVALPPTVPPACKVCKRNPAAVCIACHSRTEANVRELTAANIGRTKASVERARANIPCRACGHDICLHQVNSPDPMLTMPSGCDSPGCDCRDFS